MKLDAAGQLTPFASDLTNGRDPVLRAEELFNGRQGDLLLVYGQNVPTIDVVNSRPIRLRIANTANGRFMRLSLPGHQMAHVGSDAVLLNTIGTIDRIDQLVDPVGGGMISNPDPSQGLLIAPSERAEVVIVPRGNVGDEIFLEWHDNATGRHSTFLNGTGGVGFGDALDDGKRPKQNLARLRCVRGRGWGPRLPLWGFWPTQAIPTDSSTERLSVFFGHAPPANDGSVTFFSAVKLSANLQAALDTKFAEAEDPNNVGPIPGMVGPPPCMPQPFKVLQAADALHAEVGETKIWEVTSFPGGFHMHGFPFQALEIIQVNLDGNTPAERVVRTTMPLATNDNILLPARPGAMGRSWTILRAVARFDDADRPFFLRRTPQEMVASGKVPVTDDPLDPSEGTSGGWLGHCYLTEHSAMGMLTFLNLILPQGTDPDRFTMETPHLLSRGRGVFSIAGRVW